MVRLLISESPFTVSLADGLLVPIPTSPALEIRIHSALLVLKTRGATVNVLKVVAKIFDWSLPNSVPAFDKLTTPPDDAPLIVSQLYPAALRGEAVPIPTLPLLSIRIRSATPFVPKYKELSAWL